MTHPRLRARSFRHAGRLVPLDAKGLRASTVILKPGEVMEWHSTKVREELLMAHRGRVWLDVRTTAARPARRVVLKAGDSLFLPRRTWHRVVNRSSSNAVYTYVTAPIT